MGRMMDLFEKSMSTFVPAERFQSEWFQLRAWIMRVGHANDTSFKCVVWPLGGDRAFWCFLASTSCHCASQKSNLICAIRTSQLCFQGCHWWKTRSCRPASWRIRIQTLCDCFWILNLESSSPALLLTLFSQFVTSWYSTVDLCNKWWWTNS